MKKRISILLEEEDISRLDKLKGSIGATNRTMAIRILIRKKKIRSKIPSDVVALNLIIQTIVARMQIILNSQYTRGQVTEWMKKLIVLSKKANEIIAKYDKH